MGTTYFLKSISFLLDQALKLLCALSVSALVCGDKSEVWLCERLKRSCDDLWGVLGYLRCLAMGEELDKDELFVYVHVDGAHCYCWA